MNLSCRCLFYVHTRFLPTLNLEFVVSNKTETASRKKATDVLRTSVGDKIMSDFFKLSFVHYYLLFIYNINNSGDIKPMKFLLKKGFFKRSLGPGTAVRLCPDILPSTPLFHLIKRFSWHRFQPFITIQL